MHKGSRPTKQHNVISMKSFFTEGRKKKKALIYFSYLQNSQFGVGLSTKKSHPNCHPSDPVHSTCASKKASWQTPLSRGKRDHRLRNKGTARGLGHCDGPSQAVHKLLRIRWLYLPRRCTAASKYQQWAHLDTSTKLSTDQKLQVTHDCISINLLTDIKRGYNRMQTSTELYNSWACFFLWFRKEIAESSQETWAEEF